LPSERPSTSTSTWHVNVNERIYKAGDTTTIAKSVDVIVVVLVLVDVDGFCIHDRIPSCRTE